MGLLSLLLTILVAVLGGAAAYWLCVALGLPVLVAIIAAVLAFAVIFGALSHDWRTHEPR
jgi:hypothetical protein